MVVAGATGGVGQLTVAKLAERGFMVRALSRDKPRCQALFAGDKARCGSAARGRKRLGLHALDAACPTVGVRHCIETGNEKDVWVCGWVRARVPRFCVGGRSAGLACDVVVPPCWRDA